MIRCKYRHPAVTTVIAFTVSLFLWGLQSQAWADGASEAKPQELRKIMQELGRNMQAITGAISQEDWALVAKLAPKVAVHPEPPLPEKMRILAYLGTDAARFRSFDAQTHEAAHDMKQVAASGDGKSVIQSFARVQESCLNCHQAFRKSYMEHFHGKR